MTFAQIYEQAKQEWEALYHGNVPVILIGTATCGRAAGAMAVIDAFKKELTRQAIEVFALWNRW